MAGKSRKDRIAQEIGLFMQQYARKAQRHAEPCDRPYDRGWKRGSSACRPRKWVGCFPQSMTRMTSPVAWARRAIVVTFCSALCACGMVMDSSFDTLQEALDSDRVNKGWIPGWVPQAATDLREVHDLDSNTSALAFTKPPAIPLQLPADCQATTFNNSDPVAFNRYWWPGNATLSASYRVFRCAPESGKSVFVSINTAEDHVLFWRTYAR